MSKEDNIIRLDEAQLRERMDRKTAESVEETLNGLLNFEKILQPYSNRLL